MFTKIIPRQNLLGKRNKDYQHTSVDSTEDTSTYWLGRLGCRIPDNDGQQRQTLDQSGSDALFDFPVLVINAGY